MGLSYRFRDRRRLKLTLNSNSYRLQTARRI